ncbi:hypothetical protein JT06_14230, partial [Desulfobulbus sp. Tol-SR]
MGKTNPGAIYVKDGKMISRKAGPKTRTRQEMEEIGAEMIGRFSKKKFVHITNKQPPYGGNTMVKRKEDVVVEPEVAAVPEEGAPVEVAGDVEVAAETAPAPVKKEGAPTKAELSQKEADAVDFTQDVFYGEGPWPKLSRAAAILLGFSRYYTGEPCINGHDAPRKTKTSACLTCSHEKLRERHKRRIKEDAEYKAKFAAKGKARRLRKKA